MRARCATIACPFSQAGRAPRCRCSTGWRGAGCRARSRPMSREIEGIATALGFSGVWFLNGSYQWGCTTMARDEDGVPWLVRTLDWPFPGLGRHVEIAHKWGEAGEFYSVTWPGYVGALTAMAPGRFAASINQAPLWRRTRHPWLRPVRSSWPMRSRPGACAISRRTSCCARCSRPARISRARARCWNDAGGAAGDLHAGRHASPASAA